MKKKAVSKEVPQGLPAQQKVAFTVLLDLHLFLTPLMQEYGDGIVFTRTLSVPFPPSGSILIGGRSMEGEILPPLGYALKNILWDQDEEVFLATTSECHCEVFLALIPQIIGTTLENGWRIGSWQKIYDPTWKSPIGDSFDVCQFDLDWDDEDELRDLDTQNASRRPKPFNQLLSAVVRMLFNLGNNEGVAYAIYRTKKYYADEKEVSPEFTSAVQAYEKMAPREQDRVQRNILKRAAKFA